MIASRPQAPFFINHQPDKGVIARYHLDTAEINSQLATLRSNGADGISLSLMLWDGIGDNDLYLDWYAGALLPQPQANFTNLLKRIKALGFNWVQLSLEFWNNHDPRKNPFTESLYDGNWFFISSLPALLDSIGLPYLIDACPEVNDVYPNNPNLQAYAKRLWVDITSWFYPGGVPCWNFSFSFVPGNWDTMTDVFSGNPPAIFVPHPYSNEDGGLYEVLEAFYTNSPTSLVTAPWLCGETDSLLDTDTVQPNDLTNFLRLSKVKLLRLCPWPEDPRTNRLVPSIVSNPWKLAGF